jgi:hypothetical protein
MGIFKGKDEVSPIPQTHVTNTWYLCVCACIMNASRQMNRYYNINKQLSRFSEIPYLVYISSSHSQSPI